VNLEILEKIYIRN